MLLTEFQYYLDHKKELIDKYHNQIIVIKDQQVVGVHSSNTEAVLESAKKYELGTFLIQQCKEGADTYTVTRFFTM